jgi:hypothetical protein
MHPTVRRERMRLQMIQYTHMTRMTRFWLSVIVRLVMFTVPALTACIPPQLPPQLAYTPGPAAVIRDHFVDMPSGYQVLRPANWDVQLSAANAPEALLLIAPDKEAVIIISTQQNYPLPDISTIPSEHRIIIDREIAVAGLPLYLWLITTAEHQDISVEVLDLLTESIAIPDNTAS